jgi:translocation and assembly module TamB
VAGAAASLATGGGEGILDMARQTLGLDVLGFGGGDSADDVGTVSAGKYLTRDVYVGVEQGATPGSTAVTVEIDLTPHITLESDVGAQQGSSVGVRWQWDY